MAVGDILKEQNLVVEYLPVKDSIDIEKGEIVIVDSGIKAAVASTTVGGPYYMAMQDFVAATYAAGGYTDPVRAAKKLGCVKVGYVEVQLKANSGAIEKGDFLEISDTDGAVQLSDLTYELQVVGVAEEAVSSTTQVTVKMTVGQMP